MYWLPLSPLFYCFIAATLLYVALAHELLESIIALVLCSALALKVGGSPPGLSPVLVMLTMLYNEHV